MTAGLEDQLYLDRTELPPAMVAHLIRGRRLSECRILSGAAPTFGKPCIVSCAELHMVGKLTSFDPPRHFAW
jgi:hypothetical protein